MGKNRLYAGVNRGQGAFRCSGLGSRADIAERLQHFQLVGVTGNPLPVAQPKGQLWPERLEFAGEIDELLGVRRWPQQIILLLRVFL